jgi:hypothetical protein
MSDRVWLFVRGLSIIAFIGFLIVGILFLITPESFTGYNISEESSLWHSLTMAFMATVTVIALMIAFKPERYWHGLLPLGVGKAVSSVSSIYWYTKHNIEFLQINTVVDGSIAAISIILFLYLLYRR